MPQKNREEAGVLSKPIRDIYQAIKQLQAVFTGGTITVTGTVSVTEPVSVDDNSGSLTVDTPQLPTTIGQKAMAASTSVVIASDQSAVPVTISSGTITAAAVAGTTAHDSPGTSVNPVGVGGYASAAAPSNVSTTTDIVRAWYLLNGAQAINVTAAGALIGGDASNGLDVDVTRLPALVAGTANIGDVDVLTVPAPLSTTGNGSAATALRVTVANDSTGVVAATTTPVGNATATLTNVGDSASSVTLLASNASRRAATFFNDSTANCYVKFGTTASTTSFTILMRAGSYYEVPGSYTGRIDGIWASDAGGDMRVTEITA